MDIGGVCDIDSTSSWRSLLNVDMQELSRFPTDLEIKRAAHEAAEETFSLFDILGVNPTQLSGPQHRTILPSFSCIEVKDSDMMEFNGNETESEAEDAAEGEELDKLVARANDSRTIEAATEKEKNNFIRLMFAAMAVDMDSMEAMYVLWFEVL
jgi:hypothetical protein